MIPTIFVLWIAVLSISEAHNLSCYQCVRTSNTQCGPEFLLPCPSNKDRCVTHITKDASTGYTLKRECGLGPCTFEDEAIHKGLGIFGDCDTSKEEFFCVSCCKTTGCNKDLATTLAPPTVSIAIAAAILVHLA
ncbi:uncharacterized protein LOC128992283 [Macrosteles quadrilineatus]|uniref:uncharacterized protein LOC128992283 n=1 Tax=Macrosteles quadrilineatus TaxID=74068 RepID=UPI0023E0A0DB|nr:uncharacterized protein LOC128992283 [Macrosteles quadrilineatus]